MTRGAGQKLSKIASRTLLTASQYVITNFHCTLKEISSSSYGYMRLFFLQYFHLSVYCTDECKQASREEREKSIDRPKVVMGEGEGSLLASNKSRLAKQMRFF